jgi:hypothetical protein
MARIGPANAGDALPDTDREPWAPGKKRESAEVGIAAGAVEQRKWPGSGKAEPLDKSYRI